MKQDYSTTDLRTTITRTGLPGLHDLTSTITLLYLSVVLFFDYFLSFLLALVRFLLAWMRGKPSSSIVLAMNSSISIIII